jgi:fatty-acyl-CoA synthase
MQERARDGKSEGEIVVRSPWLTQGYHRAEEQSEQLWQGGYLHTGDIGVINKQGYLSITDRLKDVIKTGGEWISSLQLEDIIARHDCVSEVAVIGQPDEKWGERPLAIVVPVKGSSLSEQDVKQVITPFVTSGVLPRWAIPDNVLFVEQIDKTSVGKVDKKQLRKKYAS